MDLMKNNLRIPSENLLNQTRHILIVDDDPTLRHIWQAIVQKLSHPCELIWASTYEAAQLAFQKMAYRGHAFDVVIADVYLPDAKLGLDLIQLRNNHTSFIFTSGSNQEQFTQMIPEGAYVPYFLSKPVNPTNCIEILNNLLKI